MIDRPLDKTLLKLELPLLEIEHELKTINYEQFSAMTTLQQERYIRLVNYVNCSLPDEGKIYSKTLDVNSIKTFEEFSYKFVKGGLTCGRMPLNYRFQPISRPFYEGGSPDLDEKRIQKKEILKKNRKKSRKIKKKRYTKIFRMFLIYRNKSKKKFYPNVYVRLGKQFTGKSPNLYRNVAIPKESNFRRFWRLFKVRKYMILSDVFSPDLNFTLANTGRKIRQSLFRLKKKKELPKIDCPHPTYSHRIPSYIRIENRSAYLDYVSSNCWQPRWKSHYQMCRHMDPIYYRWFWSTRHKGSFLHNRQSIVGGTFSKSNVLTNHYHCMNSLDYKLFKHGRHTQILLGSALRSYRRHHYQRRLLRLRRAYEEYLAPEDYHIHSSCDTYSYYRLNRYVIFETNKIVKNAPFLKYMMREQRIRSKLNPRFFMSYYYNYFRKKSAHNLLRGWRRDRRRRKRTKSGQIRMKPIKDHPIWGLAFNSSRQRRFDFLRDNLITRLSRKVKLKKWLTPYNFISNMHAQQIDTRRKIDIDTPENRSRTSFLLAFLDGLSVEKKQKKVFPGTIAASSSFNRRSINLEIDLAPLSNLARPAVEHYEEVRILDSYEVKVDRPSMLRRLKYIHWPLFLCLWYVYYFFAKLTCEGINIVTFFCQDVYDNLKVWYIAQWKLLKFFLFNPIKKLSRFIRGTKYVRLITWIYTSWLYVDLMGDDHYAQDFTAFESVDQDITPDEEIDPNDDRQEEDEESYESDIGFNMESYSTSRSVFGYNSPVWEWYFLNVPDEEILELFDEAGYFVRLIVRPFTDFIIRLPLWSFLDWSTTLVEAVKSDYQRSWYKILVYKNTKDKIHGRWWKIILILVKCSIRLTVWLIFLFWMISLLSSAELELIITYNFGWSWFEEYYYFYVMGCFLSSVYLLGPISLRDFCFKELGFENSLFVFVVPACGAFPQGYQPDRSGYALYRLLDTKYPIGYGEKEQYAWLYNYMNRNEMCTPDGVLIADDTIRVFPAMNGEFNSVLGEWDEEFWWHVDEIQRLRNEQATFNFSERYPSSIRNDWDHRERFSWEHHWTVSVAVPGEDEKYIQADTGNQYWNRTIVNRMEYPQNLRETFRQKSR